MEKNTLLAVLLSTVFLLVWWTYFQPAPQRKPAPPAQQETVAEATSTPKGAARPEVKARPAETAPRQPAQEKEITAEGANYKAVFTTRGAAVMHWYLEEKDGSIVDLILQPETPALSTYPDVNFALVEQAPGKLVFSARPQQGLTVTKTFTLSDNYLHSVDIRVSKAAGQALPLEIAWFAGLGTDQKELKENLGLLRATGFTLEKPRKLEKLKPGEYGAANYQWVALDNRYFLAAFIFGDRNGFEKVSVARPSKSQPPQIALTAPLPQDSGATSYSLRFYLGPKGYTHLKTLGLNLEEAVDFGWFGFLGKMALSVINTLYKLTGNYGWAIVFLTIGLQILVFPLSMKSFKASIAMKKLQPHIKKLQETYKGDPKRLNVEMLNLYKTQKVNPLGGCLPMLLQLPIFWALFTTLRNAYELRGAPWMLWVTDLSAPDTLLRIAGLPLNVLPLIMGVGMFFQQKLMTATTDPAQAKMMYLMPVIFTFMFWNFPSGLVLYWLINNILTVTEQYIVMKREPDTVN